MLDWTAVSTGLITGIPDAQTLYAENIGFACKLVVEAGPYRDGKCAIYQTLTVTTFLFAQKQHLLVYHRVYTSSEWTDWQRFISADEVASMTSRLYLHSVKLSVQYSDTQSIGEIMLNITNRSDEDINLLTYLKNRGFYCAMKDDPEYVYPATGRVSLEDGSLVIGVYVTQYDASSIGGASQIYDTLGCVCFVPSTTKVTYRTFGKGINYSYVDRILQA
jgi:hypothetical protein